MDLTWIEIHKHLPASRAKMLFLDVLLQDLQGILCFPRLSQFLAVDPPDCQGETVAQIMSRSHTSGQARSAVHSCQIAKTIQIPSEFGFCLHFVAFVQPTQKMSGFAALDQCREHLEMRAAVIMVFASNKGQRGQWEHLMGTDERPEQ
jgi:hypothetical protein